MEEENWSEAVEDLVHSGDTDGAISLLETHVSNLQTLNSSSPALASALTDLATLYSSKGFSLKADDLRSQASLLKLQALSWYISLFGYWRNKHKHKPKLLFLISVINEGIGIQLPIQLAIAL
jgi:hypothetical protein